MAEEEIIIEGGDPNEEEVIEFPGGDPNEEEVIEFPGGDPNEEENAFLETINEESFDNCYKRTRSDFIELVTFGKQFFPSFQEPNLVNTIKYVNLAESILSQLEEQQYKQCTVNLRTKLSNNCVNCCGCGS